MGEDPWVIAAFPHLYCESVMKIKINPSGRFVVICKICAQLLVWSSDTVAVRVGVLHGCTEASVCRDFIPRATSARTTVRLGRHITYLVGTFFRGDSPNHLSSMPTKLEWPRGSAERWKISEEERVLQGGHLSLGS